MGADFRSAWIEFGSRLPGVVHPGLAASVGADTESLKDVIKKELPGLLRKDPTLRAYVLELTRREFADR